MGITTGLVLIAVILIGGTIAGVSFSDMLEDAQAFVIEQEEKRNDSTEPDLARNGNWATDTGTRVCDLEINFVGVVGGHDFYQFAVAPENLTTEDTFVYMGDHGKDAFGVFELIDNQNKNIIDYQWHCKGVAGTNLSWLTNVGTDNLVQNSVFSKTGGEVIRMKFTGTADNGKKLFDDNGLVQFQNIQTLSFDKEFPVALNVQIYLEKVTEDDYTLKFWSDTSQIGVGSEPRDKGTQFTYDLKKPSS